MCMQVALRDHKMGCLFSKHLKQQVSTDGWTSPASRATTPRAKTITANYSVERYHPHLVSLTSTSYGSLKIESPKPAEMRLTHDTAAFSSPNHMNGQPQTLELMDSALINSSQDINTTMQSTLQTYVCKSPMLLEANDQRGSLRSLGLMDSAHIKPFCNVTNLQNTISRCPAQLEEDEQEQCKIKSAELVCPETINVKEMMTCLEEAAPSHGCSGAPKAKTLKQNIQSKKKANATEEDTGSFRNTSMTPASEGRDDEHGKENGSHVQGAQRTMPTLPESTKSPLDDAPFSQGSSSLYKSATSAWSASCHIPPLLNLSQPTSKSAASSKSNMNQARDIQPVREESIVTRRVVAERGSSCGGVQISNSSRGMSSTSLPPLPQSIQYASSNGNRYGSATTAKTDAGRPLFWSSKSIHTAELDRKLYDPFECFKVKCPPGGEEAVVLYTTTLRGIRKTFEGCNRAREMLQSLSLSIDERDVSMHLEFLNELKELMDRVVSVPRMFIKGRYIGGVEEVVKLHEDGRLSELIQGLPKQMNGYP